MEYIYYGYYQKAMIENKKEISKSKLVISNIHSINK